MTDQNQPIDWEAIEHEYRAGIYSIRELARWNKVDEALIRRRAKKWGWQRNLADRVRTAAEEEMIRHDGALPADSPQPQRARARDEAIVANAARMLSEVVLSHRRDLAALHLQKRSLLQRLVDARQLDIDVAAGTKPPPQGYEPLPLAAEAAILEAIARIEAKLIPLERTAHNLDAKNDPETAKKEAEERRPRVFVAPAKVPTEPQVRPLTQDDIEEAQ